MKKIYIPLFVSLILLSASANSQWIRDGKFVAESEDRKSIANFAAQLVLISDFEKFKKDWDKPQVPNIKTGDKIKMGESLTGTIFFANCKQINSKCNVKVRYKLTHPSNKVENIPEQILWNQEISKSNIIYLGAAMLKFSVGDSDEKGKYILEADVKDKNSENSLNLKSSFTVY